MTQENAIFFIENCIRLKAHLDDGYSFFDAMDKVIKEDDKVEELLALQREQDV